MLSFFLVRNGRKTFEKKKKAPLLEECPQKRGVCLSVRTATLFVYALILFAKACFDKKIKHGFRQRNTCGNVKKKLNFGNSLMQIINYAVESSLRATVGITLYFTSIPQNSIIFQ